ncbi:Lrp/AsnC family transcriptional regulator [bacterium]|nr:MAG: Lrp/AsnC family transcriptional regulator [bacterium]
MGRRAVRTADPTMVGHAASSIDAADKIIIEQLQEDGRRPYTAIAAAVGLSEAAVRQRVRNLIDAGVMQIVAVTDPLRLGFRLMAMVGIRIEGDLMAAAGALAAVPEVDYVVLTVGTFDLLVELVCEDHDHLLRLLTQKIRVVPGVARTETFTYLRVLKETYTYGTR